MKIDQPKRVLSASMLKQLNDDSLFVKHEWKELVEKMFCSDDPKLRSIGSQERETIMLKEKVLKVSMNRTL